MNRLLEVCCGDLPSVAAAARAGAPRIELCSGLSADGVTPSFALIQEARRLFKGRLHLLVRPNDSGFVYSPAEKEMTLMDIMIASKLGVDGIVAGALTDDGMIDEEYVDEVAAICRDRKLSFTFHRAFDRVTDQQEALETLVSLGADRVLTSGGVATAFEGRGRLRDLVKQAGKRIVILAGGGVSASNARKLCEYTGCTEVHGSCRRHGSPHSCESEIRLIIDSIS